MTVSQSTSDKVKILVVHLAIIDMLSNEEAWKSNVFA